jgi:hypothetical protein
MAVDLDADTNHLWGIATRLKWIPLSGEAKQQRDIDTCWMRDKLFDALEELTEYRASLKAKQETVNDGFFSMQEFSDVLKGKKGVGK